MTVSITDTLQIQQIARFPGEVVDCLLADYEFYQYRHWRGFGFDAPKDLLRWDLLNRAPCEEDLCLLATDGSKPLGLAWVVASHWDSEQLAVNVFELRHLITIGDRESRRGIAVALLEAVRQRLSGEITCLVHRVDSADYATLAALGAQGFCPVDTVVSLIRGPDVRPFLARRFRRPCSVRPYRDEDWPAVEAIARNSRFSERFYNDPRFETARVDRFYMEWVRRCCQHLAADEVIVALRNGHVGGFLSYQFQQQLYEAAGIRLMGRGLLAVAPECKGLAIELIRGACLSELRADSIQCDMHLSNLELLRVYHQGFRMQIAHIRHVFHGWLDRDI